MKQEDKEKKLEEIEKDLCDLVGRIKGSHGWYVSERTYESIRNLALVGKRIMQDCCEIMKTYDKTYDKNRIHYDLQDILGY